MTPELVALAIVALVVWFCLAWDSRHEDWSDGD